MQKNGENMNNPITIDPAAYMSITGGTSLVGRALANLLADEGSPTSVP